MSGCVLSPCPHRAVPGTFHPLLGVLGEGAVGFVGLRIGKRDDFLHFPWDSLLPRCRYSEKCSLSFSSPFGHETAMPPRKTSLQEQALPGAWGPPWSRVSGSGLSCRGPAPPPPTLWHLYSPLQGGVWVWYKVPGSHCSLLASEASGIFHTVVTPFPEDACQDTGRSREYLDGPCSGTFPKLLLRLGSTTT